MRRRLVATLLLLAGIVVLQVVFVTRKVPEIDGKRYDAKAVTLRTEDGVRYGYLHTMHGAILVRSSTSDPSRGATGPAADPEIVAIMTRALADVPRHALAEGTFYFAFLSLFLWGIPTVYGRLTGASGGALRKAAVVGVLAAAAMFSFLAPRTFLAYGASAFSSWGGPWPDGCGYGYPYLSGMPGETVSYRGLLEIALLPSMKAGALAGDLWFSISRSVPGLTVLVLLHIGEPSHESNRLYSWFFLLAPAFSAGAAVAYGCVKWKQA